MAGCTLPTGCRPRSRVPCSVLVALTWALVVGGVRAEPAAESVQVVHHLPFPADTTYKVFQGNDQGPSHDDPWNRYAFDFSPLPESSPICATADGKVVYVKEDTAGPTGDWHDNNEIAILHADGDVGTYLHLEQDGATVEVGDVVYAGDVIGRAGNTGNSVARHLHFGLRRGTRLGPSVPCRFVDVAGGGVPKTGDRATSKNVAGRRLREAIQAFETLYEHAAALDAREALGRQLAALPKRPPRAIDDALDALGRRADFVDLVERSRDALLARHAGEAEQTRERMQRALDEGDLVAALYLATAGKREFAALEARRQFAAALTELRSREGGRDALQAARPRLSLREKIVRAVARDLDTREKAARGKRVRWQGVAALYEQALKAAEALPAEDVAERLRALLAIVAARDPR